MAKVSDNWSRLVQATIRREQLRLAGQIHERQSSGLANAVPDSLPTRIDAMFQAADEIQDEDMHAARILCEQAYSMAVELDPNSDGRGILQFKAGLMSVFKQKLSKTDGKRIDRSRDPQRLWDFYQHYKRVHRVDEIQRQEQRMLESGNFSADIGGLKLRSEETKKVFTTLRALVEVMKALSKDAAPDGVGKYIKEELKRLKKIDQGWSGDLMPYNIVPLEAPSLTNAIIGTYPEVRGAVSAISYLEQFPKLPADFEVPAQPNLDMFDLLEFVFGFQNDNINNQRENVVLVLANSQSRLGIPAEAKPKIDEKAITEVFLKVLDNYIKWCKHLHVRVVWNSLQDIMSRDRKLLLISLYLLIWGEAANVRFAPECICYMFHHMARELYAILDHGEANHAASCTGNSNLVSFLAQIIQPIYDTLSKEAARNNNGKAAHSAWRNYDDFNEYFWSSACFELGWPMDSPFLRWPKNTQRNGKNIFVEHWTFLHLYRNFYGLWIFLIVMFQELTIIAFNDGKLNRSTFSTLLSMGPSYAIMKFVECCLDVLLTFRAYRTAKSMEILRLVIRFLWCALSSVFITYVYMKFLQERNDNASSSVNFQIYLLIVGVYAVVRSVFAIQEQYFVGRDLYERPMHYIRYVLHWLVIFACKFTFAYFLQIKPLVDPTNIIKDHLSLQYLWHDLVSKDNNNVLTLVSIWAPVVSIYLLDIHIWCILLPAIIGHAMGAPGQLSEIRSIEMVHKRFESFPASQAKRMPVIVKSYQCSKDNDKTYAAQFSPFWIE